MSKKKTISLSGMLVVQEVGALKLRLNEVVKVPSIKLDLSLMEYADTSTLQLLFAFKKTRDRLGLKTSFTEPQEIVSVSLSNLGLSEMLDKS